jgi:alpha-N-arabinofuranosidase
MSAAARQMNGLSLHFYTLPTGSWSRKGSATEFGEDLWHSTFAETLRMEELIARHVAIMDAHDPEKRVGLVVDEWGTWYEVEPGQNPGFLYQQNTLRDALVAAINLDIFNRHADRVTMANIAQTVNVLQAMILTDRDKVVLTPSYHVFEMYKVHQGATLVPVELATPSYQLGAKSIPMLHASASRDGAGRLHLSIVNLDPAREATVRIAQGFASVTGRVLTAERMNEHNTFERGDALRPAPLTGIATGASSVTLTIPSKSVVVLELRG